MLLLRINKGHLDASPAVCILSSILLVPFIWMSTLMGGASGRGEGLCPAVCACKWKGGKQTVECIDRALITIPEHVDGSTQVLDMSGNNLQILPQDTFVRTGLLNLQRIYLRSCRIGQIHDFAFRGLTNLVELDLSHNLLTAVPSVTLSQIPLLRDLTLAKNPIQKIEGHAFTTVPHLVKLDLSHCDLQTVAPQAFEGLRLLHALKLNGNKLIELRPHTVETLSRLHGVELHDNPWVCDCRLRAAKIWLTDNNIPYPVAPVCTGGPERVLDRTFAELTVDDFACRPEMLPVSRYIEATTGENATIHCRADAVPAATINWYWNGRLLVNNSAFSSYQKVHVFEMGQFEKTSRLVLTNAQETDSSDFYCVAENRAGTAEANFTLHVSMRQAGMATLGSGQIAGLSAALVILILFILLIILFLLVRLRRAPFIDTKTPNRLDTVITSVGGNNQSNSNLKACTQNSVNDAAAGNERTLTQDIKHTNPVQKPPRLSDISYSTTHYDPNGSLIGGPGSCFLSPTASADNNPDLINDTKQLESGDFQLGEQQLGTTSQAVLQQQQQQTEVVAGDAKGELFERPGSGEYSRMGCDSLYPSGLWETSSGLPPTEEHFLRRTAAATGGHPYVYSDKTPIMGGSSHSINFDDAERVGFQGGGGISNATVRMVSDPTGVNTSHNECTNALGYPADYGLPIGGGTIERNHPKPPHGMPTNAKTIRVWQRGGVPVLPPVTAALKRALTSNRNSPDEGYQEGCGTDV
ncbi:leucine-rich repeat-containing protein 24 [Lutzomyia longipalpis]|uniref:leucine-rich repeat-containing protein 24 n=1 Tax=Lutzomyia longipalpis TaxID=7200 RepID=UPI00248359A9|nr:leucine-rich repeat-containing protein 24 [Lutzomyia longipalpis]